MFPLAHSTVDVDDHHQSYYTTPIKVIELEEVSPPPRREPPSTFYSSSSSFYTDSDSDSDDESACTSYCSSDAQEQEETKQVCYDQESYNTKLGRVLAWRDGFAKAMGISISPADASSYSTFPQISKRKIDEESLDDDTDSHVSKRSRTDSMISQDDEPPVKSWSRRRMSAHSCSACDSCFATRQSLKQHGQDPTLGDACRVAVEYLFE